MIVYIEAVQIYGFAYDLGDLLFLDLSIIFLNLN